MFQPYAAWTLSYCHLPYHERQCGALQLAVRGEASRAAPCSICVADSVLSGYPVRFVSLNSSLGAEIGIRGKGTNIKNLVTHRVKYPSEISYPPLQYPSCRDLSSSAAQAVETTALRIPRLDQPSSVVSQYV